MNPECSGVEPDLRLPADVEQAFGGPGGLFDVPVTDLHANVGRLATWARPHTPFQRGALVRVVTVQRIFDGSLAYRVHESPGDFGRPARPEELAWVEESAPFQVVTWSERRRFIALGGGLRLDTQASARVLAAEVPAFLTALRAAGQRVACTRAGQVGRDV